jgi:hypothetical protein
MQKNTPLALLITLALLATGPWAAAAVIDPFSFSPSADDPNLQAWYRADTGVQQTAGNVSGWIDSSLSVPSASRNLTGFNNPQFIPSEPSLGGLPVVRFNGGSSTYLARPAGNSPVIGNTDRTVFAVITNGINAGAPGNHILHFGNPSGDQAYGVLYHAGGTNLGNHYWGGFDPGTTALTNAATAIAFAYDGDGTSPTQGLDAFFIDGVPAGTVLPSTAGNMLNTGSNEFTVGSRISPFAEGFTGDIAEIIIYDELLSSTEINQIHGYLADKFGLDIAGALAPPGVPEVPEPTSILLFALVLTLGGWCHFRRRRNARLLSAAL